MFIYYTSTEQESIKITLLLQNYLQLKIHVGQMRARHGSLSIIRSHIMDDKMKYYLTEIINKLNQISAAVSHRDSSPTLIHKHQEFPEPDSELQVSGP